MKLLLELSLECESLAQAEAVATALSLGHKASIVRSGQGVMILDTDADPVRLSRRLGLCHYVSEWLGSAERDGLEGLCKGIDVPGPIRVRSTKVGNDMADLAEASRRVGAIVGMTRGVDLSSPKTDLRVVFSNGVHLGLLKGSVDRPSFEKRKNRHMPFVYPASLHPKFARALVNLTGVGPGGKILDPFCGTGAILAEAALSGLDPLGGDIAERMIEGSGENLGHLGLHARLVRCDVAEITDIFGKVDGIATDPPYGKSTSTEGEKIPDLYRRAFKAFSESLGSDSRVAMVVPDVRLLSGMSDFELEQKHDLWVHRSLTRTFCVLRRL